MPRMSIQKENFISKPKKIGLEKAYFLCHPNSGSSVQNARLFYKILF